VTTFNGKEAGLQVLWGGSSDNGAYNRWYLNQASCFNADDNYRSMIGDFLFRGIIRFGPWRPQTNVLVSFFLMVFMFSIMIERPLFQAMDLLVGVKLLPFGLANSQNETTISRFGVGHAMVVRPTIRPRCKSQSVEAEL